MKGKDKDVQDSLSITVCAKTWMRNLIYHYWICSGQADRRFSASILSQWRYQALKQCFSLPQGALEKIDTLFIFASEKCRADFQRCPGVFELLKTNTPDINIE